LEIRTQFLGGGFGFSGLRGRLGRFGGEAIGLETFQLVAGVVLEAFVDLDPPV